MSSFAGVSVIADGKLLRSPASPTTASESGYHLLVVEGHSRTRTHIESRYFNVGGHRWRISYSPGSISFRLHLAEHTTGRPAVKAHFEFSFVDETGKQEPARIHGGKVFEFRGFGEPWEYNAHQKLFAREALDKHLKNDSFTVRCDIMVVNHAMAVPVIDVPVPPSDMLQNFTDLLLAGQGTDVVFRVGGEMVSAHRCVLAARSSVFRAMLFGPMKEGTSSMAAAVQIDDMDATVFRAMLGFMYGDSVQVPDVVDDGPMLDQLLVAADRYDLPRLMAICKKKPRELRKMQVFVVLPRLCRAPVVLEASRDDTVASVKARLHDMEGIRPYRQRLTLMFAGSALPDDDGLTLADHGVSDSSTIQLVETNMQVLVYTDRWVVFSDIASSDTVESFRARIQERTGCPPEQQRLDHGNRWLEDGHTLADYGIQDCSSLQVTCRPAYRRSRMVELYIEVTDTVGRIKERLEEAEGVPTECQKVCFRGMELDDGRELADYGALERGSPVVVYCERCLPENGDATKRITKRKELDGGILGRNVQETR